MVHTPDFMPDMPDRKPGSVAEPGLEEYLLNYLKNKPEKGMNRVMAFENPEAVIDTVLDRIDKAVEGTEQHGPFTEEHPPRVFSADEARMYRSLLVTNVEKIVEPVVKDLGDRLFEAADQGLDKEDTGEERLSIRLMRKLRSNEAVAIRKMKKERPESVLERYERFESLERAINSEVSEMQTRAVASYLGKRPDISLAIRLLSPTEVKMVLPVRKMHINEDTGDEETYFIEEEQTVVIPAPLVDTDLPSVRDERNERLAEERAKLKAVGDTANVIAAQTWVSDDFGKRSPAEQDEALKKLGQDEIYKP